MWWALDYKSTAIRYGLPTLSWEQDGVTSQLWLFVVFLQDLVRLSKKTHKSVAPTPKALSVFRNTSNWGKWEILYDVKGKKLSKTASLNSLASGKDFKLW